MNNVVLLGRITKELELRSNSEGTRSCSFTLAVNGYNNQTDFIPVIVFGTQADNLCKYCGKGSQLAVSGRIQVRSYDKQDGTKGYSTNVVANQVTFIGSKSKENDALSDFSNDIELVNDDDLPF